MTMFSCRACGATDGSKVVDLGAQPAADYFPPATSTDDDPRWPLELWLCHECTLVQLGPIEPLLPEPPLAIESATSLAHAESSVKELLRRYPELSDGSVFEFASHHGGSWLDHLRSAGCRIIGDDDALRQHGRADLVIDVHGIAHEPAIGEAFQLRVDRLAPGGLLVMDFHHLLPLLTGNQFDTIRHGHWSYLSLGALSNLAARHGLRPVDVRSVDMFGGSLQVFLRADGASAPSDRVDLGEVVPQTTTKPSEFQRLLQDRRDRRQGGLQRVLELEAEAGLGDATALAALQDHADTTAKALHQWVTDHQAAGRKVLAYGAPSKAPVLLGLSNIGPELLEFTVDKAPGKHGRRIPGVGVPIRPVDELRAARPDVVLILTWDIADEVIGQLEADGGWGASYVVPLPTPRVIAKTAR